MWTCFSLATGESVCSIGRFKTGEVAKHHRASLFEKNSFRPAALSIASRSYFIYTPRRFLLSFNQQRRELQVRTVRRCTTHRMMVHKPSLHSLNDSGNATASSRSRQPYVRQPPSFRQQTHHHSSKSPQTPNASDTRCTPRLQRIVPSNSYPSQCRWHL